MEKQRGRVPTNRCSVCRYCNPACANGACSCSVAADGISNGVIPPPSLESGHYVQGLQDLSSPGLEATLSVTHRPSFALQQHHTWEYEYDQHRRLLDQHLQLEKRWRQWAYTQEVRGAGRLPPVRQGEILVTRPTPQSSSFDWTPLEQRNRQRGDEWRLHMSPVHNQTSSSSHLDQITGGTAAHEADANVRQEVVTGDAVGSDGPKVSPLDAALQGALSNRRLLELKGSDGSMAGNWRAANALFDALDRDGDGVISREEFADIDAVISGKQVTHSSHTFGGRGGSPTFGGRGGSPSVDNASPDSSAVKRLALKEIEPSPPIQLGSEGLDEAERRRLAERGRQLRSTPRRFSDGGVTDAERMVAEAAGVAAESAATLISAARAVPDPFGDPHAAVVPAAVRPAPLPESSVPQMTVLKVDRRPGDSAVTFQNFSSKQNLQSLDLFDRLDVNADGVLSRDEFLAGRSALGLEQVQQKPVMSPLELDKVLLPPGVGSLPPASPRDPTVGFRGAGYPGSLSSPRNTEHIPTVLISPPSSPSGPSGYLEEETFVDPATGERKQRYWRVIGQVDDFRSQEARLGAASIASASLPPTRVDGPLIGSPRGRSGVGALAAAKDLFDHIDVNGDGVISRSEFSALEAGGNMTKAARVEGVASGLGGIGSPGDLLREDMRRLLAEAKHLCAGNATTEEKMIWLSKQEKIIDGIRATYKGEATKKLTEDLLRQLRRRVMDGV